MDYFLLPETTKVRRIIPKNTFDPYTNSQQKKLFSDKVTRITWIQKISKETINLPSNDISEIQIFKIELKVREDISAILAIIDKAIPYHIIFIVEFDNLLYLSTSKKHSHPADENTAVIDWTFKTDWHSQSDRLYKLNLKKSIDAVFKDLCIQLTGRQDLAHESIEAIIEFQQQVIQLKKEIVQLESSISKSKQFNKKVEFNLLLNEKRSALKNIGYKER